MTLLQGKLLNPGRSAHATRKGKPMRGSSGELENRAFVLIASPFCSMPVALRQILETRDCVIGDRCAKRKCNSSELVCLLHGQISCGDQEEICVAASLFGSLVLESSRTVLDDDQIRVFGLLADWVMHSSSAAVVCSSLRAMSNCFAARKQPSPLTHQMCSRLISFILHPCTAFESPQEPSSVVGLPSEQLRQDLQVCACRLLSTSATFLQFCSEPDVKVPSLKPSFKAAVLSSGPSFDAQIYSENCMKVAHLAFAPGTTVRLTAAILDALASSPRPLFIFGLLQLKQQQCVDLLHTGHPSVRAALCRLLIVSLSTAAAPSTSLNGLGPSDASRALCRLLGMSETVKQAVQVIGSLLSQRPSQPLLQFFLSQRLIHAICKLMATPNPNSGLLETLFDCMAKLTSSCEEARRVVVDYCEEQEAKQGVLVTVALGHINSSSSRLRHSSAHFLLTMSRSPLAIRSVFVDACVAPVLLSLLSSPYFDEALQLDVSGEVVVIQNSAARACSADEFSYSAIVIAIISNCLLPLSLFRDVLIFSGTLVPLVCRCAIDSKDRELRSNSLCAISSMMASQTSQELKLSILTKLDVARLLRMLDWGSTLEQELCLLILRNCADGPAQDIGALLMMLKLHDSTDALSVDHFSEFCFGGGNACSCTHAPESAPRLELRGRDTTKLHFCAFHDCPTDEVDGASMRCLDSCTQIRRCLASIVSFCDSSTSSPTTVEQLLLLLANIASGSSGRKALVLEALNPSFMAEALASDEDVVRRVSLARCFLMLCSISLLCMRPFGFYAF